MTDEKLQLQIHDIDGLASGLQETPVDERDFSLGGVFGTIDVASIPLTDWLVADPVEIKDQGGLDFCTGYALASVSEDQEGVPLDPGFAFAMIKKVRGEWKQWGGDLRSGCKVAQEIGLIEVGQNPEDFGTKGRDFVANWNNWTHINDLVKLAAKHAKASYFKVDGGYDTFDNYRAALWQNRAEKRSIYTGCTWRPGWKGAPGGIIEDEGAIGGGVGHAFKVCGQKMINGQPYLVVQNSIGKEWGDNGLYYFPRAVINREFTFGAYMFKDLPPEEAKAILKEKGLLGEEPCDPYKNFWCWIKHLFKH